MLIVTIGGPVGFVATLFFSPATRGNEPAADPEMGRLAKAA
jgi:hypothetical protein